MTQSDSSNRTEHVFAQYIRILGKGKTGTRSLSEEEAEQAFSLLLAGAVEPIQTGAFLMLLRVKEESPEELSGFARACYRAMKPAPATLSADLNWSSYAGKRHQQAWFLLAVQLLASHGYRVFLHGSAGHTPGRLYTQQVMQQLNMPVACQGWQQASAQLDAFNLTYLPLAQFLPALETLMHLKPLLGLRSPVNTLARLLNPLRAKHSIHSIFHPAYANLHRDCEQLLQQPAAMVFKGDGGEVEVRPQADTKLSILRNGIKSEAVIPRQQSGKIATQAELNAEQLQRLWRGESHDSYGLDAVMGTCASALLLLQADSSPQQALQQARRLWENRDKGLL